MITHTIQNQWLKIRSAVSDTDTAMTADGAGGSPTKEWGSRSTTKGIIIPMAGNGIGITLMGDVEDAEATISLYVYQERGPARFVCGATFTIGAQQVIEDPTSPTSGESSLLYADAVAITDQAWPQNYFNYLPEDGVGADEIAEIQFDCQGTKFILIEVSALDEGLTVTPIMRYW